MKLQRFIMVMPRSLFFDVPDANREINGARDNNLLAPLFADEIENMTRFNVRDALNLTYDAIWFGHFSGSTR